MTNCFGVMLSFYPMIFADEAKLFFFAVSDSVYASESTVSSSCITVAAQKILAMSAPRSNKFMFYQGINDRAFRLPSGKPSEPYIIAFRYYLETLPHFEKSIIYIKEHPNSTNFYILGLVQFQKRFTKESAEQMCKANPSYIDGIQISLEDFTMNLVAKSWNASVKTTLHEHRDGRDLSGPYLDKTRKPKPKKKRKSKEIPSAHTPSEKQKVQNREYHENETKIQLLQKERDDLLSKQHLDQRMIREFCNIIIDLKTPSPREQIEVGKEVAKELAKVAKEVAKEVPKEVRNSAVDGDDWQRDPKISRKMKYLELLQQRRAKVKSKPD